jgi:hypothetical protein
MCFGLAQCNLPIGILHLCTAFKPLTRFVLLPDSYGDCYFTIKNVPYSVFIIDGSQNCGTRDFIELTDVFCKAVYSRYDITSKMF